MPPDDLTPETQLALIAQEMKYIAEGVQEIRRTQAVVAEIVKSVAVHDTQINSVSERMSLVEDRFHASNEASAARLQDITKQFLISFQQVTSQTDESIKRTHSRIDQHEAGLSEHSRKTTEAVQATEKLMLERIDDMEGQLSSRISNTESTVSYASGAVRILAWIIGLGAVAIIGSIGWALNNMAATHDETIRLNEHVRVLEQQVFTKGK